MTVKSIRAMEDRTYLSSKTLCLGEEISKALKLKYNYLECVKHDYETMSLFNKTLNILERLGLSIDELGTYYLAEITTMGFLKMESSAKEQQQELVSQLKTPFSGYYFNIARNEKDIGVRTFHTIIEQAFENMNTEKIDRDLENRIYTSFPINDYGDLILAIIECLKEGTNSKEKLPINQNRNTTTGRRMYIRSLVQGK